MVCYNGAVIIHLLGTDTYRTRQKMAWYRDGFRKKYDPSGYNTVTLDGETMTAEDLRASLTAGGLFGTKRFIAIDGYTGKKQIVTPEALGEILHPVAAGTDVIVVCREVPGSSESEGTGKKKGGGPKKKLTLAEAKETHRFDLPTPAAAAVWLAGEAKLRGGSLSPTVAQQMVALCGCDTWRLANELDKLIAYANGRPISAADVNEQIVSDESPNIFALTDAVGGQRRALAVRLVHRELAAGTNPLALIATLANHLWNIRRVQRAVADGRPADAIASTLGLHPYVVQKTMAQARSFSPDLLARWHHQLVATDATLKSSGLDAEALLDVLLLQA